MIKKGSHDIIQPITAYLTRIKASGYESNLEGEQRPACMIRIAEFVSILVLAKNRSTTADAQAAPHLDGTDVVLLLLCSNQGICWVAGIGSKVAVDVGEARPQDQ